MEKVPPKKRNTRGATSEELMKLDKRELVERIHQLEAHNFQLKNIIQKKQPNIARTTNKDEKKRPFNFSNCHYRRVLLRVLYFGWEYQGLAVQEDSTDTIEHHLFSALSKTCLIEGRDSSGYHRCGRTDKGVSAFGQVISISLRSKYPPERQLEATSIKNEIPYCKLLNRLLPEDIRAVAWMPIPDDKPDYSARFDCHERLYKYYFPRSNLDIASMQIACKQLVGSHDFRNLCKMDVGNGVTEFIRRVHDAEIRPVDGNDTDSPTSMYYLQIKGNAFLWHQIRCIFGVLLLIGQRYESCDVIKQLLDVETNPCKPQYSLALDVPLNLFHCSYELERDSEWVCERDETRLLIAQLQGYWTMQSVKSTMIKDCLQSLESEFKSVIESAQKPEREDASAGESERDSTVNKKSEKRDESFVENNKDRKEQREMQDTITDGSEREAVERGSEKEDGLACKREGNKVMAHADCLLQGVKTRIYKPLLKRDKCSSLEQRIEYYKKRRKLSDTNEVEDK